MYFYFLYTFRCEIAIDDILVNLGSCSRINVCDFESNDLCDYQNDNTADFEWMREQGTDEGFDHSYGSSFGHYMKAVSPANPVIGQNARLISPSYSATTLCAQFWYKTNGNMHFSLKTLSFGTLSSNTYFKFRGSNGNNWELGQATVSHPYAFQLVFESLVSVLNSMGYVLLDDIEIRFKPCAQPASCNFEENSCGYNSLKNEDFEWLVVEGQFAVNQNTWLLPQFDHTYSTSFGRFIYLDSKRKVGSTAKIQSELLVAPLSLQCVQFYIYMKMNGGILNVYRERKDINQESEKLLTENAANLDNLWYEREIELTVFDQQENQDASFKIIFEGLTQNEEGALAIDDIKLYNGKCAGPPEVSGMFNCQNGQVVNMSAACDFVNDCSNGLDEKFCGTCDFENEYGYCGWMEKSSGSYFWERNRDGTLENNKPSVDHTYGNRTGLC